MTTSAPRINRRAVSGVRVLLAVRALVRLAHIKKFCKAEHDGLRVGLGVCLGHGRILAMVGGHSNGV
jgi:hypothetical protein